MEQASPKPLEIVAMILAGSIAFVLVYATLWLVPLWGYRQIKNVNPRPTTSGEVERQKQLQACIDNKGKPEAWSDGTFKKCN